MNIEMTIKTYVFKMFVICMYNNDIYMIEVNWEPRIFSGHKFD